MVRKLVLPVVALTMLAVATSTAAAQRGGGGGGGARGVRSGPSQGHAVPRAGAPSGGPHGGRRRLLPRLRPTRTLGLRTIGGLTRTTIAGTIPTIGRIRITTRVSASDSDSDSPSRIHRSITAIQTHLRIRTHIHTRTRIRTLTRIHTQAVHTRTPRHRRLIRRLTRPIRGPRRTIRAPA